MQEQAFAGSRQLEEGSWKDEFNQLQRSHKFTGKRHTNMYTHVVVTEPCTYDHLVEANSG